MTFPYPNFTSIPNQFIEHLMPLLNELELKAFLLLNREHLSTVQYDNSRTYDERIKDLVADLRELSEKLEMREEIYRLLRDAYLGGDL